MAAGRKAEKIVAHQVFKFRLDQCINIRISQPKEKVKLNG
jgi:hypothetical protein